MAYIKKNAAFITGIALSVLSLAALIFANAAFGANYMDSDSAAELALARLLADEGRILSPNWYYSTELRLFNTQLIFAPLFKVFSNWNTVRIIGGVILYAMLALSYIFLAKQLRLKNSVLFLTMPLLFIMPSVQYWLFIAVGAFYIPHIIIVFLYIGCYFWFLNRRAAIKSRLAPALCFLALSLLCGLSGLRYILIIVAPMFLCSLLRLFTSSAYKKISTKPSKQDLSTFFKSPPFAEFFYSAISLAVTAIGFLIANGPLAAKYSQRNFSGAAMYGFGEDSFARLGNFIRGFFNTLGLREDVPLISSYGISNVLIFALCFLGIFVLAQALKTKNKPIEQSPQDVNTENFCTEESAINDIPRFFAQLFIISLILNLAAFFFTDIFTDRYYILVFILFIPAFAAYLNNNTKWLEKRLVALCLAVCLLLPSAITLREASLSKTSAFKAPANFLVSEGYEFGYATFWHAGISSFFANGSVQIAPIVSSEDSVPLYWLTRAEYFDESYRPDLEKTFMLLTLAEYESFKGSEKEQQGTVVYQDENLIVLEYDYSVLRSYVLADG